MMWSACLSHLDNIWPVRTYSIKGSTGLNKYSSPSNGNICTSSNEMWPVVQFYSSNIVPSAVSVGIWIPSSASTPQVGFMWSTTSLTREETSTFQIHRPSMEVPCSGVPLGSLEGFWDGRRLWEINSRVWKSQRIEEKRYHDLPSMFETELDFNWFTSWCLYIVVPALYVSREQGGCLRLSLFLNMNFDVTQDSRQSSYVIVHDTTQSKDEQDWTGIVLLPMVISALLGMKCGPLCSSIFPIHPVQCSFGGSLDTKFCLHAAGGICVYANFEHSGGKIEVSNSSAEERGGAVRRSFLLGLWQDFEMVVGSVRSTPWSEIEKTWRDFDDLPSMFAT